MDSFIVIISVIFVFLISGIIAALYYMRVAKADDCKCQTENIEKVVYNSNKGEDFKDYVQQLNKYNIRYNGWKD